MSNPHRSEAAIELGGERFILRLTLQALAEIEAGIAPDGLGALAERFARGQFILSEIIVMLGALVRGGGRMTSDRSLAETLDAAELPALLAVVSRIFAGALAEGPAAQGPDPGEGARAPVAAMPFCRGAR